MGPNAQDARAAGRQVRQGTTDALNRGVVASGLGSAADMGNMLLNLGKAAYGYAGHKAGLLRPDQMPELNDRPMLGSEWWGDKMQAAGMVSPERNAAAELIAGGVLAPAAGVKLAQAAPRIAAAALQAAENMAAPRAAGMAEGQRGAIKVRPTVDNVQRIAFPGVYARPDEIVRKAASQVVPESPLLKQLFGVTRDDLYEMSKRPGNIDGVIPGAAANPKGSAAAEAVMTRRNATRILDVLQEVQRQSPELWKGMHSWYTMDPEYQAMVRLLGPEEGAKAYARLNTFGGIESPNMPVTKEFDRASAANWLATQGRWDDWVKYGGLPAEERAAVAPADMMAIPGRVGHVRASTSQGKYLTTGAHGMDSPKAPPYIDASSVPELGFQTNVPVGDAHWSRAIGLADTRTNAGFDASVSTPEIQQLTPWFNKQIAQKAGLEAVPAQAIMWGAFSPQTGVKTAIGAPKLELHALEIAKAARRMGVSPLKARDMILSGKAHAGAAAGAATALGAGSGLLEQQDLQ